MPSGEINLPIMSDEMEDSFSGATERMFTVHFGVPNPPVAGNPTTPKFVRWDQPMNFDDMAKGAIGSRSAMWHPARTLRLNEAGLDGKDFARDGYPDEAEGNVIDDWGL